MMLLLHTLSTGECCMQYISFVDNLQLTFREHSLGAHFTPKPEIARDRRASATVRQSRNVLDLHGFTATTVKPPEYPYLLPTLGEPGWTQTSHAYLWNELPNVGNQKVSPV